VETPEDEFFESRFDYEAEDRYRFSPRLRLPAGDA
jgi:hypothetical protein